MPERDYGCFRTFVVFGILQSRNDGKETDKVKNN